LSISLKNSDTAQNIMQQVT